MGAARPRAALSSPGRVSRDPFPRAHARTQRFTLGEPRSFRVAPDGSRVVFLRAPAGDDPTTALWSVDLPEGSERCVADPSQIAAATDLPPEERVRRERVRETAGGIVSYATDRAVTRAVFTLGGKVHLADLVSGEQRPLPITDVAVDPRLGPAGRRVAYVSDGALRMIDADEGAPRTIAADDDAEVTWGLAEFIAAEEMGRTRGFWWAPDGERLAVARVDTRGVARWHIADPVDPHRPSQTVAYPAAGTANARVELHLVDLHGGRLQLTWDAEAFPYLVDVVWAGDSPLTLLVQSRDQRRMQVLVADTRTGECDVRWEQTDERWTEIVPGLPRWLPSDRLVHTMDVEDTRRLAVDGKPVTPPGLQVRRLAGVAGSDCYVLASRDPVNVEAWRVPTDGSEPELLSPAAGVHDLAVGRTSHVLVRRSLDAPGVEAVVHHAGGQTPIRSLAATPPLVPNVVLDRLGERDLCAALLTPTGHDGEPLPVLLDPYGGPHAQRVLAHQQAFLTSQWFAEQGFAVLVADGRGHPGRGLAWEKAIAGDLATAPLTDQVDALHAAAKRWPFLDLDRVAIRGWSYGGYVAALAVLRRPDVFHAAIAGAPVTDWTLYDTHYTERYLGTPSDEPDAYERSSLLADARRLERPLLLIHGLADDNVVAAHTLRLSRALLEAGRPHTVLPLSGVTHMTPQEVVAENLLRLQLDFLQRALPDRGVSTKPQIDR
jgi:dipeptidyl-peptidase 4